MCPDAHSLIMNLEQGLHTFERSHFRTGPEPISNVWIMHKELVLKAFDLVVGMDKDLLTKLFAFDRDWCL